MNTNMANPLLLLVSIAQSVAAALAQHQGNSATVAEWAGYLNLAAALATRVTSGSHDLKTLDAQLQAAVAGNRGLTSVERKEWRARADIATDIARKWLADHPAP